MYKKILMSFALIVVVFAGSVYAADTNESQYQYLDTQIHAFKLIYHGSYTTENEYIEAEQPVTLFSLDDEYIEITKLKEIEDEKGIYVVPIVNDGIPELVKISDPDYFETINLLLFDWGSLNITVESDGHFHSLVIEMRDIGAGNLFYPSMARMFTKYPKKYYTGNGTGPEVTKNHLLSNTTAGSLLVVDSNLNYNAYDVPTGEFELFDSGCINPDLMDFETLKYDYSAFERFVHPAYEFEKAMSNGYVELFEDTRDYIKDGIKGTFRTLENLDIFKVNDGVPEASLYYLKELLDMRLSQDKENNIIRLYKLYDRPKGDDFYGIVEFSLGSTKAKFITAKGEEEFELSFAPYEITISKPLPDATMIPILDILDALGFTYHYPRANGGILIANFRYY